MAISRSRHTTRSRSRSRSRSRARSRSPPRSPLRSRSPTGRRAAAATSVPSRGENDTDSQYLKELAKATGMSLPNLFRKYWQFKEMYPEATFRTFASNVVGDTMDLSVLGAKLGWNTVRAARHLPKAIVKRGRSSLRRGRSSLRRGRSSIRRAGSSVAKKVSSVASRGRSSARRYSRRLSDWWNRKAGPV